MLARKIVFTIIVFGAVLIGAARIQGVVLENGNRGLATAVRDVNGMVIPFGLTAGSDINVGGHKNYKENEIIVKFKKPVSDTLGQQLAGKSLLKNLSITKSIDNLNSKHGVKSIEPVFKDFNAGREKIKNLLKKSPQELSRDEKRILRRQQRAPKNAKVPELDRIYKVKVEEGQSAEQAVADYRNNPAVEYAELNYKVSACLTPNDFNYPKQWPLNNTGQNYPESGDYNPPPGTPGCDINASKAWILSIGSSEIVVAVIDTGVDYNHMDLQGNMWTDANGRYGYDFVNDDNEPMDDYGHGTHCAGIIAARTNNSLDIAGISWNTKIMAVKILDSTGGGWLTDVVEGIKYAVNNGAEVLSNSWGVGTQPEDEGPNTIREAIQYAVSNGAIVVAAAGNENTSTPSYPAAYENVISVAATDSNDDRASFSNYGSWVDIAAPGVDILSLHAAGTDMYGDGKHFYPYSDPNATMYISSGTSMACPYVSGACALLLSVNPYLSCDDVNSILRNTAHVLKDQSTCASGRLDIYKAMLNVSSSKGSINMDRLSYSCDANIGIYLRDLDIAGNNSYNVNLTTSGGDSEIVTLYAVSPGIGIFTGSIAAGSGDPCKYDGKLQVTDGQIITVTYYDADDGTGNPAESNDTAKADCGCPIISNVSFAEELIGVEQVISFQTSEPTTARIIRGTGTGCGETDMVYEDLTMQSNHVIKFSDMEPLTNYYFKMEVNDPAGNTTVDSNNGNCYRFVTDVGPRNINVPGDCNTIQQAIDIAWDGSTICLADGTYTGTGNRDVDFKGKVVTVKSVNGPNNCIIDCQGTGRAFLFNNYEGATSVLQGLTVMDGNSDVGGAIEILYSSPRIDGCVFRANSAINGGAILCINGNIEINNCTFTDNRGYVYGSGGAIIVSGGQITITHCLFSANTAVGYGGAIFAYATDQRIDRCTFVGNICQAGGGAIHQTDGFLTATNCAILNNSTNAVGGGFRFSSYSGLNTSIFNCTFSGNKADFGGGGIYNHNSYLKVSNSILWGNGANGQCDEIYPEDTHFSYCDINGCGGSGAGWNTLMGSDDGNNIDKDPLFTDANLHISEDSPCVDAGNPDGNYNGQTDIDGELRVQGLRADIGADEVPMHVRNVTGHNSYLSIQDAINEASNGDEIVVYPGTYYESLDFHGLSVAIRGAEPNNWDTVAATVIDGSGATSGLNFHHGETSSASLTGVTIEGSNNGIVCLNTSPTISKCIVKNNTTRGIWGFHGSPTLTNNKVFNNGNYNICLQSTANPVVRNNEIYDAKYGIWLIAPRGVAAISNNTIVRHAKRGISKTGGGPVPKITNCIVWDCKDDLYGCSASYSCIEDGDSGAGNIHLPPCFVDADNNDFHINIRNSPCVDSVNPGGNYDGQTDIDNELRLRNQRVDMGADEVWRRVRNTTNGNWYSHIQDAVNEASRGDEIVVSTGTYYESINFNGRAITVRSSNPNDWNVVAATIIDCKVNIQQLPRGQWQRCGFIFEKGEDRNSILAGFTVTNGMGLIAYDIQSGGAIFCDGSSPTIRQCILKNNDLTMTNLDSGGGAIVCYFGANPLIEKCIISENKAAWGGGIGIWESSPIIRNCIMWGNTASYGAGICLFSSTNSKIQNCTIVDNLSDYAGGIFGADSTPTITNCILWGNGDELNGCSATYSCIRNSDSGTGNIHSDPCFVDNSYCHIGVNSLCVNAGDPDGNYTGQTDIDGEARVIGRRVDIGADEFNFNLPEPNWHHRHFRRH